jgi:hypothetical protein
MFEGNEMKSESRNIAYSSVSALRPYGRNARTHSKKQLKQIAASIERFGFVNPILVGEDGATLQVMGGQGIGDGPGSDHPPVAYERS